MEHSRIVIRYPDGSIKGLYSGILSDILINVFDGETYEIVNDTYELPKTPEMLFIEEKYRLSKIKGIKVDAVSKIIVTISTGKVFDGDELSQDRMLRAINIATITGEVQTEWKMADNSKQIVSLDELKEALALSGQEMSTIWLS